MDFAVIVDNARPIVIAMALKILGAIAIYIIGRWLIGIAGNLLTRALERQKIEPTVVRYIGNTLTVALNILLVIGILGYFGVETTSFAALIAALGIAIGAAWGGLLSNFAAGVFILVLRPFKEGDYVLAGEVEGTVRAIGLFTTALDTPDTRSWETLPARIAVARVRLPAGRHRVVIDARGWARSQDIVVEKGGWQVVSLMALR